MRTQLIRLLIALALCASLHRAAAQGTEFTYQGLLNAGGSPANGLFDFRFRVDEDPLGNTIRATVLTNAVPVSNGLFIVVLDFGPGVFTGSNYWLEIDVTSNLANGYTTLNPLQPLTPTPYAIFANTASNVTGAISGAQITGPVPSASLTGTYGSALTLNNTGNSFTGNGANLKSLNASQLTTGTVADARLSTNVALLNGSQTFTGANKFNNAGNNFTGNFIGSGASISNVTFGSLSPNGDFSWGNFQVSSSPGTGTTPVFVCAADVNGDGFVDLINVNFNNGNNGSLTIFTNNGSGGFVSNATFNASNALYSVTAADVNGDGFVDLITAGANGFGANGTLSVLTNNGRGGFVIATNLTVGVQPEAVIAADVNRDGFMDLISANFNNGQSGSLTVLTNNGHGGFVTATNITVGSGPDSVIAADVNGDGFMDLICVNVGGATGTLTVLTNNGHGGFVTATNITVADYPYNVIAVDVNGDGFVDLVCSDATEGPATLTVLTNNGLGGFVISSTSVANGPFSVCAADVNHDGFMDLICANQQFNTLTLFTNNGQGGFTNPATLRVGPAPQAVIAADVNGDGEPDLITANSGNSTLSVLLNVPVFSAGVPNLYTPTISDGNGNLFTTTTQYGSYTKVGNLVYFELQLVWNTTGAASNTAALQISLPVPVASQRAAFSLGFVKGITFNNELTAGANNGQSDFLLYDLSKTGAKPTGITVSDCSAAGEFQISGSYRWQ